MDSDTPVKSNPLLFCATEMKNDVATADKKDVRVGGTKQSHPEGLVITAKTQERKAMKSKNKRPRSSKSTSHHKSKGKLGRQRKHRKSKTKNKESGDGCCVSFLLACLFCHCPQPFHPDESPVPRQTGYPPHQDVVPRQPRRRERADSISNKIGQTYNDMKITYEYHECCINTTDCLQIFFEFSTFCHHR